MPGVRDEAVRRGARLPEVWLDEIYTAIYEALASQVELIPGVSEVLDALDQAGIGYAIGSNGPHAKMQVTLGRTGLLDRLQGRIYSREDVPNPKPAPDVYLKAARDAGVGPSDCVVIEDSASGARAGQGQSDHVDQSGRRTFWRCGNDPGNAIQGQSRSAGRRAGMVARA